MFKAMSKRIFYFCLAIFAFLALIVGQYQVFRHFVIKRSDSVTYVNKTINTLKNNFEDVIVNTEVLFSKVTETKCKISKRPPKIVYSGLVDERVNISSDPSPYKGPIVEGWGPDASRDVRKYVKPYENSVLLAPFNLGGDPDWCTSTRLFIFQHTRPTNFAIRLDNRRTWMNYMKEYPHIKAIFVVGHPSGPKAAEIQNKINAEHKLYGDILQIDYIEHANNNTLKTIFALKYIFSLNWNGHYPEFVMKSDDDVYINLPLFSKLLFEKDEFRSESLESSLAKRWPPLIGHMFITSPVLLVQPEKVNEKFTDYLICPSYMYNKLNYPTFTSGTGYIIPWWALPCFYQESMNLPYFFIEDVFMGGFVADRCLIPKKEPEGFSPGRKEWQEVKADFDLLIHYMDHEYKFNVHRIITAGHNQGLDSRR